MKLTSKATSKSNESSATSAAVQKTSNNDHVIDLCSSDDDDDTMSDDSTVVLDSESDSTEDNATHDQLEEIKKMDYRTLQSKCKEMGVPAKGQAKRLRKDLSNHLQVHLQAENLKVKLQESRNEIALKDGKIEELEQKLAAHIVEKERLAEEQKLAEEARIVEEQSMAEEARIVKKKRD